MAGWEIAISFFPYWEIDDPKGVGTEIRHSKKHSAWLEKTHHVGLGQNLQRDMFGDEHPFIYLLFCGSPGIPCVLTHTHEDHPNQFQMGPRFALER